MQAKYFSEFSLDKLGEKVNAFISSPDKCIRNVQLTIGQAWHGNEQKPLYCTQILFEKALKKGEEYAED